MSATAIDAEKEQQALDDDQLARVAYARRVWDAGTDPRGTLGEKYLNEQRRLNFETLCLRVLVITALPMAK